MAKRPAASTATSGNMGPPRRDAPQLTQLTARLCDAGVSRDQLISVENHLRTLTGATLSKEADLLHHVLESPNTDRATATYHRLLEMSKESPAAASRLTTEIREELVRGVADRSTQSMKGTKGVLGQRHAEEAARALIQMPQADYDRLRRTLDRAGFDGHGSPAEGADAHAERALILKAVGARVDHLKTAALDVLAQHMRIAFNTPCGRAIGEITKFAGTIRGMRRKDLILHTTAVDVWDNPTENPAARYDFGRQRYTSSCSPANAQNVRSEHDPIFAMKVRKELSLCGNDSESARQQKDVLERPRFLDPHLEPVAATPKQLRQWRKYGMTPRWGVTGSQGVAVSWLGLALEPVLDEMLRRDLSSENYETVKKYITNQKLTISEKKLALQLIDRINLKTIEAGNLPKEAVDHLDPRAAVSYIRSNYIRGVNGTSIRKSEKGMIPMAALAEIAPPPGRKKWRASITNGGKGGLSDAEITDLDIALKRGTVVPIGIANWIDEGQTCDDGHDLMISDVRGEGTSTKYLVTDPAFCKTEWISRAELQDYDSKWPRKYFGHPAQGVIDIYYEH
jgi:hypothetical protein